MARVLRSLKFCEIQVNSLTCRPRSQAFWSIIVGNALLAAAYGILWCGARKFGGKIGQEMAKSSNADLLREMIGFATQLEKRTDHRIVAQVIIDQARPNSHPVMPIDAHLINGPIGGAPKSKLRGKAPKR